MKKLYIILGVMGVLFALHYLVRGSYAYRHIRIDFEESTKHIGSHFAPGIHDHELTARLNHRIIVVMYLPEPKEWMHLYSLTMVTPEGKEVLLIDEPILYKVANLKRIADVPYHKQRAEKNEYERPFLDRYIRYPNEKGYGNDEFIFYVGDRIRKVVVGKYRWGMLKQEETIDLRFIFVYSFDEDEVITEEFIIPATLQRWPTPFTYLRP